ncbi:hypothetical protein PRIC1_002541 [Phytophthora ramorum]
MAGTSKLAGDSHLDSFASATGLMQLSSAAVAADAANNNSNSSNSSSTSTAVSSSADASLPPGWQRIIHGSGLPCYVHDGLGVVCWTRPYPLDVGVEGALSQPELHRLVKQHVPPLSIFAPTTDAARRRKESLSGVEVAGTASPSLLALASQEPSSAQSKKRKLDNVLKERVTQEKGSSSGKQPSMTLEEFKSLFVGDPRVLQACMELSIKTPAQVLQEYQNRNRGVSINYNTVPVEGEGVKLFKTIVTAGSTVAEGVASTKKIAKQLGAQQLLAMLHERTARKYYEVAEMYNSSLKGQPIITESSTYGPTTPLHNDATRGGRGSTDPRLQRGAPVNRVRRGRRTPPNQEFNVGGGYREYEVDRRMNAPPHWSGYNQQPMQHLPQQPGPWNGDVQQGEVGMDNAGPERVVVYSTTPAVNVPGAYGGGQYYNNNNVGGNAWGGYPNANYPVPQPNLTGAYPQQYNGGYGEAQPPPGNGPYGYNYHSRSSDRPNTSTPIEKVTANLRNQMSNP